MLVVVGAVAAYGIYGKAQGPIGPVGSPLVTFDPVFANGTEAVYQGAQNFCYNCFSPCVPGISMTGLYVGNKDSVANCHAPGANGLKLSETGNTFSFNSTINRGQHSTYTITSVQFRIFSLNGLDGVLTGRIFQYSSSGYTQIATSSNLITTGFLPPYCQASVWPTASSTAQRLPPPPTPGIWNIQDCLKAPWVTFQFNNVQVKPNVIYFVVYTIDSILSYGSAPPGNFPELADLAVNTSYLTQVGLPNFRGVGTHIDFYCFSTTVCTWFPDSLFRRPNDPLRDR